MQTKYYISLAVITYLVSLLVLTPAATVLELVKPPQNKIQIHGVSGTLWNGTAQQINVNHKNVNNFSWDLSLFDLLLGQLSSAVSVDYQQIPVHSDLSLSLFSQAISLKNTKAQFSAEQLQKLLDLPFGELGGKLILNMSETSFTTTRFPETIDGQLHWIQASLTLGNRIQFGDIKVNVSKKTANEIEANISNSKGELIIKGNLKLNNRGVYRLDMTLEPRSNASDDLTGALKLIAPRKNGKAHVIQQNGNLTQFGIKL